MFRVLEFDYKREGTSKGALGEAPTFPTTIFFPLLFQYSLTHYEYRCTQGNILLCVCHVSFLGLIIFVYGIRELNWRLINTLGVERHLVLKVKG